VQQRQVEQQVDRDHREHAGDHAARQVARGVAVLLGEIRRARPSRCR
jgi:hypothetical protein